MVFFLMLSTGNFCHCSRHQQLLEESYAVNAQLLQRKQYLRRRSTCFRWLEWALMILYVGHTTTSRFFFFFFLFSGLFLSFLFFGEGLRGV